MNVVIPMAGEGRRFADAGFLDPKPLIEIASKPMIQRVIESLQIQANYIFIVRRCPKLNKLKEILFNLKNKIPEVQKVDFVEIDNLTEGPACTALLATSHINHHEELIVANCDQIMWWNGKEFQKYCSNSTYDGVLVTYYANTAKNSYAKIDKKGFVIEVKEKEIISNISLNGIHFWKKGKYFIDSATKMIKNKEKSINGEFYVGPAFNNMIQDGLKVGIYHIPNYQHHAVGTPDDLREYIRNENS
tara:strand:- start:79 stop:816 length:738 start_codon:yes stop_codon:yes gene_type:complete